MATSKSLVLDLGYAEGATAGFRAKLDFMRGEPTVFVHLVWNDSPTATHTYEIDASDIRDALEWMSKRDGTNE